MEKRIQEDLIEEVNEIYDINIETLIELYDGDKISEIEYDFLKLQYEIHKDDMIIHLKKGGK